MGDIKSAADIAKEKLAKLGDVTDEERLTWKYVPEGEKLAARYIQENINLVDDLKNYEEKARKYVSVGISVILIRNISLPRNDIAKKNNEKAMEGLKAVKNDKVAVDDVFGKIKHIMDHYVEQGEQQKKQSYELLKVEWEDKIREALKQQTGVDTQMKIDVEVQPQFQEAWRKLQAQLEAQYLSHLDEYKHELAAID